MKKIKLLKSRKVIIIFIILIITVTTKTSFTQLSHVNNIALPDLNTDPSIVDPGSIVGDIIYAQDMVFVYSVNKVLIYEGTGNNNYIKTVNLSTETQNDNENYGKFSPLFFNTRMHIDDVQVMTYNDTGQILYVLGADLRIYGIKVDPTPSNIIVDFVIDRPSDIDYLAPLHGLANLKYSNSQNRLYCVIGGRNNTKSGYFTGMFHYRDVYFTIYNLNTDGTMNQQIYDELYYLNNDNDPFGYSNAIIDIEINEETFGTVGDFYSIFYLARNGRVEIYKISGNTVSHLNNLDINLDFYKVGKMLYIHQNGINKVLVFPYRTPASDFEPPLTTSVNFYEIDGNDPTASGWGATNHHVVAPHKRILDASFIPGQNDLILSYSNDDYFNIAAAENTDIAFYSYDFTNNNFGTAATQYLNTNGTPNENPLSLNRPLKIHTKENYTLLSKKDEIIKVYYSDGAYHHSETPLLSGESNYYYSGAIYNNNFFILNLAKNGIEILNQDSHIKSIRTGFQCLNISHNPISNKLYFFNKLNVHGNGMYLFDMVSGEVETFIEVEKPIGDVIYNPFQNHMLVSENSVTDNKAIITIIDDNAITGSIDLGAGTHHPKEMFIAPNGNLYIAVNMRNDTPKIIVIDANDYNNIIGNYDISGINPTPYYNIYNADFCYNPYNRNVYATITTNNTTIPGTADGNEFSSLDPYFPVLNSSHDYNSLTPIVYPGVLVEFNENGMTTLRSTQPQPPDNFSGPREIICSTPDNAPEGYKGSLYINADKLIIYDCATGTFENDVDINFNDITYNSNQNMVYGFTDKAYIDPATQNNENSWRVAEVYSVDANGTISPNLYTHNGQLASIFTNPHNGLLYLQSKVDETRLGNVPMSLIEIDPVNTQIEPFSVTLQNKSHYVELDKNGDYHFHNYNLTTPFIDPYQNRFYLPNGGHSNVSVVEFSPNEPLVLNNDAFDWISIPRLNRDNGDPSVNDVLYDHIFPDNYQQYSVLKNVPPGAFDEAKSIYTGVSWPQVQYLTNIYSPRGYKLKLLYNDPPDFKWLQMEGDVIDRNTTIPLYGGKDNWVGYFIYKEQDIFDALGEVLHYSLVIRAEDWFCYFDGPYRDPGTPVPSSAGWICDNNKHNVKYGDMVIIETDWVPQNYMFTWQNSGLPTDKVSDAESEYFAYAETADYTPISILLDTTENPTEIGAFVNDSCIGGCTVQPEDTLVGIKAYLEGQSGDSITFETWTNTKSTSRKKIVSYNIYNPVSKRFEKGSIKLNKKRNVYKVSFGKPQTPNIEYLDNVSDFWIYPNPAEHNLYIEYELENKSNVVIKVYNIIGGEVAIIIQGNQLAGKQKLFWDLIKDNGEKLPSGIYTIRLKAGGKIITKKLVIN
ncbi:MAG: T9SS type A sorting domain-containing protein [Bacteroidetes bacterium]|nr:T9SS type A sorting domain-containing protein [Bacteroidota bacterium]